MCDDLCSALRRQIPCNAIHGDKEQREREHVLAEFKSGRAPIMIATDVAARGLDIKDVRMVRCAAAASSPAAAPSPSPLTPPASPHPCPHPRPTRPATRPPLSSCSLLFAFVSCACLFKR